MIKFFILLPFPNEQMKEGSAGGRVTNQKNRKILTNITSPREAPNNFVLIDHNRKPQCLNLIFAVYDIPLSIFTVIIL